MGANAAASRLVVPAELRLGTVVLGGSLVKPKPIYFHRNRCVFTPEIARGARSSGGKADVLVWWDVFGDHTTCDAVQLFASPDCSGTPAAKYQNTAYMSFFTPPARLCTSYSHAASRPHPNPLMPQSFPMCPSVRTPLPPPIRPSHTPLPCAPPMRPSMRPSPPCAPPMRPPHAPPPCAPPMRPPHAPPPCAPPMRPPHAPPPCSPSMRPFPPCALPPHAPPPCTPPMRPSHAPLPCAPPMSPSPLCACENSVTKMGATLNAIKTDASVKSIRCVLSECRTVPSQALAILLRPAATISALRLPSFPFIVLCPLPASPIAPAFSLAPCLSFPSSTPFSTLPLLSTLSLSFPPSAPPLHPLPLLPLSPINDVLLWSSARVPLDSS
ncbi:unnamed protein product [Closterium sp. Naga37s-1]|nr:unnamed protein product [Closterium sp. Naga37s-1]